MNILGVALDNLLFLSIAISLIDGTAIPSCTVNLARRSKN